MIELATTQVAWGATVLDVNVGVPGIDEVALLPEVVKLVASVVKTPICIDTPNLDALAAALPVAPGKPLVNSVNGEEKSLRRVLPLVKDRGAAVIGLTMDDNGIPATAEERLAVAARIIERATAMGIPIEDIIIDPLVLTVGADSKAAAVTLETIRLLRQEFGVNINLGASNVSFGLPDRHTINQAFLALAIGQGATCMITDPMKLTAIIRADRSVAGPRHVLETLGVFLPPASAGERSELCLYCETGNWRSTPIRCCGARGPTRAGARPPAQAGGCGRGRDR